MIGLGGLWLLIVGVILLTPLLALLAFIRVGTVQKRLNILEREFEKLRHRDPLPPPPKPLEIPIPPPREPLPPSDPFTGIPLNIPPEKPRDPEKKVAIEPTTPPPARPTVVQAPPSSGEIPTLDWDRFTGVKLFSWIGGFALFMGAAFFVKYSIDHSWVSPLMRVMAGFVAGTGALLAGIHTHKRGYSVTGQTLGAAGCAILYANTSAAHALYGLLNAESAFAFMTLVTAVAFLLAIRMDSPYVAILGLLGGFLTPPLFSTGVDQALGLFSYVTLLDVGLVLVALRKRWMYLISAAALGTVLMQTGWAQQFFEASKMTTAASIVLWFAGLFAVARRMSEKTDPNDSHSLHSAGLLSLVAVVGMGFFALKNTAVAVQPTVPFSVLILSNILLAGLALRHEKFQGYHVLAGGISFFSLMMWTNQFLSPALLPHALLVTLLLGGWHGAFAVILHRRGGSSTAVALGQIYPVILLIPVLLTLTRQTASPVFLWPVAFLLNGVTILAALTTGFFWALLGALGLSLLTASLWMGRLSSGDLPSLLLVIGGIAALFFGAGLWFLKRNERTNQEGSPKEQKAWALPPELADTLPALGCLLPFLLLGQAAVHLKLTNPAPVFGVGALLILLLLSLAIRRGARTGILVPMGLISMALLQFVWHRELFSLSDPWVVLPWYTGTLAVFLALPFLSKSFGALFESWMTSAGAGPILFFFLYKTYSTLFGTNTLGALPAGLAVLYSLSLWEIIRHPSESLPRKQTLLAAFGGVTLFFISLIFPLQFDREWITLGWALEGMALVWLFGRVPHPGLKVWGGTLLTIAFVRLAANPTVFAYHPRTGTPFFNWYLYAYGVTTVCLLLAARFWQTSAAEKGASSDETRPEISFRSGLNAMGIVLLFLLMNIQIADWFSTGTTLTFNLRGSLTQDMSYTLGWGLFGLALLVVGLWKDSLGARRASFALLAVTIGKLFLHDVWRLTLLYRAAAFVGLAVVLILSSFLYQRFLRGREEKKP